MKIVKYESTYEDIWDSFITEKSCNGTFLQSRRFLNYHPEGRFADTSYLVFNDKQHLVAVCPACEIIEDGKKIFYSHSGSTYGGILIDRKLYKTVKVIEIIRSIEEQCRADGFSRMLIKQTPSLLAAESADLIQYCFYYLEFQCCNELNLYVDFESYKEDIMAEFSQGKRTDVHNCQKRGLYYRKLTTYEEITELHRLLEITLAKYRKKPVHTPEELYEFQTKRLHEECECFGVFGDDKMLAASMMFYFNNVEIAHAQYLCAEPDYKQLSPMTFMYYVMLVEMRKRGYKKVSWGVATEDFGQYLNEGLVKSKEYYGSKYGVNQTFIKDFN